MGKIAYCIKEVVKATSLSRATLYRAIRRGELKAVKLGRRTLISGEALQMFVAQLSPALVRPTRNKKSGSSR